MQRTELNTDAQGKLILWSGLSKEAHSHGQIVQAELAAILGIAQREIVIGRTDRGKPYLQSPGNQLQFSYAHREDFLVLAMHQTSEPVGVDLEILRQDLPFADLVETYFSPEEITYFQKIARESERAEYFFCLWTMKEAYLKATGQGITQGLHYPQVERYFSKDQNCFNFQIKIPERWTTLSRLHHLKYSVGMKVLFVTEITLSASAP